MQLMKQTKYVTAKKTMEKREGTASAMQTYEVVKRVFNICKIYNIFFLRFKSSAKQKSRLHMQSVLFPLSLYLIKKD